MTGRRRGSALFSVVALLAAAAFVALRCPAGGRIIEEPVREPGATIRIKDFVRESAVVGGHKEWRVRADEAFLFQKGEEDNRVIAYGFQFEQFNEAGAVVERLTAERGEIDYNASSVLVEGKVEFWSANGRRVSAETLQYDRELELLTSDSPLTIRERSSVTHCSRGAEIDNLNNRQVCRGPVIASQPSRPEQNNEGNPLDLFQ